MVTFTQPTQSNPVLAVLPFAATQRLRKSYRFYAWDPARGEVRWMCAFDTTASDVDTFCAAVEAALDESASDH